MVIKKTEGFVYSVTSYLPIYFIKKIQAEIVPLFFPSTAEFFRQAIIANLGGFISSVAPPEFEAEKKRNFSIGLNLKILSYLNLGNWDVSSYLRGVGYNYYILFKRIIEGSPAPPPVIVDPEGVVTVAGHRFNLKNRREGVIGSSKP